MKTTTIRLDVLDPASIEKAEDQVRKYIADIKAKQKLFVTRLSEWGQTRLEFRWTDVIYFSTHLETLGCEKTKDGFVLTAEGEAVCFIEFGAGVHFNGSERHPIPRPDGVVGIGEYGHHLGRFDHWYYTDEEGNRVRSEGNPANMPMYRTMQDIIDNVTRIAREVFG